MANRYWVGDSGNWSDTSHWSSTSGGTSGASKPTYQDDVFFDANSFTTTGQTVIIDEDANTQNMSWAGVTNTPTLAGSFNIRIKEGDLTLVSGMVLTFSGDFLLGYRAGFNPSVTTAVTVNLDTGGLTIPGNVNCAATTSINLLSDVVVLGEFEALVNVQGTHTTGTFNTNDFDITAGGGDGIVINAGTEVVLGTSILTLNGTGASVSINQSANYLGNINGASASIVGDAAGSYEIGIGYTGATFTGTLGTVSILQGTCWFNKVFSGVVVTNVSVAAGVTFKLFSATTTEIVNFTAFGTEGSLITIARQGGTGSAQMTLNVSGVLTIAYISVSNCIAAGVNIPFINIPGGVDGGNNTNWIFPIPGTSLPAYNTSLITSVTRVQQNASFPSFVFGGLGGASGTTYAIFKKATSYGFTVWRSEVFVVGRKFDVTEIILRIIGGLAVGMRVIPTLYFDNGYSYSTGTTISTTTYSSGKKRIRLTPHNFDNGVSGSSNFFLELQFTGATLASVGLPIEIEFDVKEET